MKKNNQKFHRHTIMGFIRELWNIKKVWNESMSDILTHSMSWVCVNIMLVAILCTVIYVTYFSYSWFDYATNDFAKMNGKV